MEFNPMLNFSNEDVSIISGSHSFAGFLTSSQIIQATTTVTSMGLDLVLEIQPSGTLQPPVVEVRSPELASGPVVFLTPLGGPADGLTESTKVGEVKPEAVRSPELLGGPLAHSTPLCKPAENLADSAKAEEAGFEAGC